MAMPRQQTAKRVQFTCCVCGVQWVDRESRKRKVCSKKCGAVLTAARYAAARTSHKCEGCGKAYLVEPYRTDDTRFCSRACGNRVIAREYAKANGDRQRGTGEGRSYTKYGRRHMHRVVAEMKIGRKLLPGEVVHHVNGNRLDNRPENLQVLASQADHARLHSTKNRVCEVEGCGRKHVAKGLCQKHWRLQRKAR